MYSKLYWISRRDQNQAKNWFLIRHSFQNCLSVTVAFHFCILKCQFKTQFYPPQLCKLTCSCSLSFFTSLNIRFLTRTCDYIEHRETFILSVFNWFMQHLISSGIALHKKACLTLKSFWCVLQYQLFNCLNTSHFLFCTLCSNSVRSSLWKCSLIITFLAFQKKMTVMMISIYLICPLHNSKLLNK